MNYDQDDSSSDASSVGHDLTTGEPVLPNYRTEQRYSRQMLRLGRARGLPAGLKYVPATRIDETAPEFTEATAASRSVAEKPNVTPYNPVNDPAKRRRLSTAAIAAARERVAERLGVAPRMVIEPTYGMLLPRDSIVNITEPRRYVDEFGQETFIAPPAVGYSADPRHMDLQMEAALQEGSVTHYARTMEVIQATRQRRVLRAVDLAE